MSTILQGAAQTRQNGNMKLVRVLYYCSISVFRHTDAFSAYRLIVGREDFVGEVAYTCRADILGPTFSAL